MVAFHAVILAAGQGTRHEIGPAEGAASARGRALGCTCAPGGGRSGAVRCSLVIPPDAAGFEKLPHRWRRNFSCRRSAWAPPMPYLWRARPWKREGGPVLVLYGDTPLVTPASIAALAAAIESGAQLVVAGLHAKDPTGYGRLITTVSGELWPSARRRTRARKSARSRCAIPASWLSTAVCCRACSTASATRTRPREYYLTDAVEDPRAAGRRVASGPSTRTKCGREHPRPACRVRKPSCRPGCGPRHGRGRNADRAGNGDLRL